MMNTAYWAWPASRRSLKLGLLAAAMLTLGACERTDPTPDPAPAPPAPQTREEWVAPHVQRAVYVYTGSQPANFARDGKKEQGPRRPQV